MEEHHDAGDARAETTVERTGVRSRRRGEVRGIAGAEMND